MGRFIKVILIIINIVVAVLLLTAYLSSYFNPLDLWILGYVGLLLPILLLLNVMFVLLWLFAWKKWLFLSLFCILTGWNHIKNYLQIPLGKDKRLRTFTIPSVENKFLKVMSYNVGLFGMHAGKGTENMDIIDFFRLENPDILCLQEFYSDTRNEMEKRIRNELPYLKYTHYQFITDKKSKKKKFGMATYSRLPIINKQVIPFENTSNKAIYSDILFNNDTVRVFNIHLQSLQLQKHNYNFLKNFAENEKQYEEFKDISIRYKSAAIKRTSQVEMVTQLVSTTKYSIIVCGDFNDTPVSYTYRRLKRGLTDAFTCSGLGLGNTFHLNLPLFRIDYILYSNHFRSFHFRVLKEKYSDHRPVVCYLVKN